jgi:hypothetical protein
VPGELRVGVLMEQHHHTAAESAIMRMIGKDYPMRRRHLSYVTILLASNLLLACSSDSDGGTEERLEGQWTVDVGTNCVSGLNLDGSKYIAALACPLVDGTTGIETEIGSYTVNGNRIVAVGEQSSCPQHTPGGSYAFNLDGDLLTLGHPSGSVTFRRRNDLMGGQGQNRYGCWENDVLTPQNITPL